MGDGSSILVKRDPWLPNLVSGLITSPLGAFYVNTRVNELMCPIELQRDRDLIVDIFNHRNQEHILNIPLSFRHIEDQWYWTQEERGLYSVKIGYRVQQDNLATASSSFWNNFWKLQVPPKVLIFICRTLQGTLPTADRLQSRMVPVSPLCPVCGVDRESTLHLFFECPFAMSCWILTPIPAHEQYESIMV